MSACASARVELTSGTPACARSGTASGSSVQPRMTASAPRATRCSAASSRTARARGSGGAECALRPHVRVEDGGVDARLHVRLGHERLAARRLEPDLVQPVGDRRVGREHADALHARHVALDGRHDRVDDVDEAHRASHGEARAERVEQDGRVRRVARHADDGAAGRVERAEDVEHRRDRARGRGVRDPRAAVRDAAGVRDERDRQVLLVRVRVGLVEEGADEVEAGVGAEAAEHADGVAAGPAGRRGGRDRAERRAGSGAVKRGARRARRSGAARRPRARARCPGGARASSLDSRARPRSGRRRRLRPPGGPLRAASARWCNGSTAPFGGVCRGSNPLRATRPPRPLARASPRRPWPSFTTSRSRCSPAGAIRRWRSGIADAYGGDARPRHAQELLRRRDLRPLRGVHPRLGPLHHPVHAAAGRPLDGAAAAWSTPRGAPRPARITAVLPYFGYARQDRKDQPRVSIAASMMAHLLEQTGVDRVLTMDLHAAQIQGFFYDPRRPPLRLDGLREDAHGRPRVGRLPPRPRRRRARRRRVEGGAGLRQALRREPRAHRQAPPRGQRRRGHEHHRRRRRLQLPRSSTTCATRPARSPRPRPRSTRPARPRSAPSARTRVLSGPGLRPHRGQPDHAHGRDRLGPARARVATRSRSSRSRRSSPSPSTASRPTSRSRPSSSANTGVEVRVRIRRRTPTLHPVSRTPMDTLTLTATARETGKKAVKATRKAGLVPCVLYGPHTEPVHFAVPTLSLRPLIHTTEQHRVTVNVGGDALDAILKEVVFHPVTERPWHVDFQALTAGETFTTTVPVELVGTPEAVRDGAELAQPIHQVEIRALPKDLPGRSRPTSRRSRSATRSTSAQLVAARGRRGPHGRRPRARDASRCARSAPTSRRPTPSWPPSSPPSPPRSAPRTTRRRPSDGATPLVRSARGDAGPGPGVPARRYRGAAVSLLSAASARSRVHRPMPRLRRPPRLDPLAAMRP